MGLAANLRDGGVLRTKIHCSLIRRNELNRLHIADDKVKAIAWSIQRGGQLENATVYEDDLQDGKKYTLIGGETRWRAISYLYDNGAVDGYVYVTVIPKPKTIHEERRLIRDDNLQREKTDEDIYLEILGAEDEYESLCESGERPSGKKRDFVGKCIGMSGRNVDNIKKKFSGLDSDGYPIPVESINKNKKEDNDKEHCKYHTQSLKNHLEKYYQCKINVTDKSVQFKCRNTEELNDLFEKLGIQDKLDDMNF